MDRGLRDAAEARRARQPDSRRAHQEILAFLENEIGLAALKRSEYAEAVAPVRGRDRSRSEDAPAYLNLGDVRLAQDDVPGAVETWEQPREHIARARVSGLLPSRAAYAR